MKAEIKGGNLIITLPMEEKVSKSEKTIIIAGTGGFQPASGLAYKDKPVFVSVNAYIKKDKKD